MDKPYEYLFSQYDEIITLEQLYRICHISKRKAKWLLDNKVIPCEDTKKKTRRYKIRLQDVAVYLSKRDLAGYGDLAPIGIFSSNCKPKRQTRREALVVEFIDYLKDEQCRSELRQYYEQRFKKFPDGLTTSDVSEMTGHTKNAVNRWIQKGRLKAYVIARVNHIPKTYLIDFLCSEYYIHAAAPSQKQKADMLDFLDWVKLKYPRRSNSDRIPT